MRYLIGALIYILFSSASSPQGLVMAKVKYKGGGDWYSNKTALPNLMSFCNQNIKTQFTNSDHHVEVGSALLFNYPILYLTGHGNVIFNDDEAKNLRNYLLSGGFLIIDDNYGLRPFVEPQMKKVFPELSFIELPFTHPVYHQKFNFDKGLPKVHEHDGKSPQGFGLIWEGRLVCFMTFESDLGNGWEDQSIYNNPETIRQQALKMGSNLVEFAFKQ